MTHRLNGISWTLLGDGPGGKVLTTRDAERLRRLLGARRVRKTAIEQEALDELAAILSEGQVVSPSRIPCDFVTINSRVLLKEEFSGASITVAPVLPSAINKTKHRISVLSPIGLAVLGRRARSEFEFTSKSGVQRIGIEKILYQPEAFGIHDS